MSCGIDRSCGGLDVTQDDVKKAVRVFLRSELLSDDVDDALLDGVHLISDGIIDSMASLRLVSFLEETFDVSIRTHQASAKYLDTLDLIADTVIDNKNRESHPGGRTDE
jgi:acyl carrier protein